MIRRFYRHIYLVFAFVALMCMHNGCIEHMDEHVYLPTGYVAFKASLNAEGATPPTKGFTSCLDFEEEEWTLETSAESSTKASLYNSLNGLEAGVYGYVYNGEWNTNYSPISDIAGDKYIFDGDQLDAEAPVRWSVVESLDSDNDKFSVFVYAPKDAVSPIYEKEDAGTGAPVLKIPNVFAKGTNDNYLYQNDILVADNTVTMNMSDKSHRKEITLDFEHIYTAIQFKAGFEGCTINEISIDGVKLGGDYVIGSGWTNLVGVDGETNLDLSLCTGDQYMLMIPQIILNESVQPIEETPDETQIETTGPTITLSYSIDGEAQTPLTASLSGVEWKQGKKITYTLMRESDREFIYMDLAAGNVLITGKNYEGYVFVKDYTEAQPISGTIAEGQKYYIYQSCVTDVNNKDAAVNGKRNYRVGWSGYDVTNKKGIGEFTLPSYPEVTYDGKRWSDYITNNTDVNAVIQAWDNAAGAGERTSSNVNTPSDIVANNDGAAGAVRNAGREATKHCIDISGDIDDLVVVIDNIYSSFHQKPSESNSITRDRTTGGIAYKPTKDSGSHLTINLVGDNRVGCVHYHNGSETNSLIFEGSGSLTAADADYFTKTYSSAQTGLSKTGYYSNRSCSAIGGADNSPYDVAKNIIFNSGVIFAGGTDAELCTAIGGGGNGYSSIVINGGTVTAVAAGTGTAIGGGTGLSQAGGEGRVTINGGNVYAYNKENCELIPTSAIGGAGSRDAKGTLGTVTINGGYVYAESDLGTAIGGGSSATKAGGEGRVTITGGTVIAKSGSDISAGIGGGSTCTRGGSHSQPNGGKATITIGDANDKTKCPIVRTGSIGGGGTNADGGTVGSAVVNVYGGDIQAQFVMAQSTGNIFTMEGGLIRNSSTSDNVYHCIKPDGAAVYMEQGTFTMKDGEIISCFADKTIDAKGGAVYIKGNANTSFTMLGGEISQCRANADGGAVYLEGGNVTINGGKIEGNVTSNGNGGAISVVGGNFTIDGTDALITANAAFGSGVKGNGGGIYVAPASSTSNAAINVSLTKGSITSNSADRNGGGVCVDMGDNSAATLSVTVGTASKGDATNAMTISGNGALIKGGGMYVNGASSSVILNDGYVQGNETSSYQVNPDMSVDGGVVTLMKPGITTQVTVTFNNNAQYFSQGDKSDTEVTQYLVAGANSVLKTYDEIKGADAVNWSQINSYYDVFKAWNTRRDGKGTLPPFVDTDKTMVSLSEDMILYAQWE